MTTSSSITTAQKQTLSATDIELLAGHYLALIARDGFYWAHENRREWEATQKPAFQWAQERRYVVFAKDPMNPRRKYLLTPAGRDWLAGLAEQAAAPQAEQAEMQEREAEEGVAA